jgi:FixJ family two-component response regulator
MPPSSRAARAPHVPVDSTAMVYVVDDDISIRESLDLLFRSVSLRPRLFGSATEFLACQRPAVPSCLVLDVTLPGLDGLQLQRQLPTGDDLPIIFITGHGDVPMTVQAMKAGAIEFLTKPFREDVLLHAVHEAIERSRASLHADAASRATRADYETLTPREREVMRLVVAGLLNKQIGGELGISEVTVKAHRGQVMRKMNAASVPALVGMAARLGLQVDGSGVEP